MKKTILISGGSEGFGKALAVAFAKKHNVVILANDKKATEHAAHEIGCEFVIADITNYAEVERAIATILKKHSAIDILINNAGLWAGGPLEGTSPKEIQRVIGVNTTGTILLTRAILPSMKAGGRGRIINVISHAGISAKKDRSVYNASKWAITGFTKSLQTELVGSGVTVTGFYPGSMKTNLFKNAGEERDMSRYMELPEVVRAVEFIVETPDELEIPELGIKPSWY
ncbi:MAG: SDR family oxidoreductase [Patescibacteria group bacterium]